MEDSNYIDHECSYCFGSGEDESDEMGRCKVCSGKGFIRNWIDYEDEEVSQ